MIHFTNNFFTHAGSQSGLSTSLYIINYNKTFRSTKQSIGLQSDTEFMSEFMFTFNYTTVARNRKLWHKIFDTEKSLP